MKTIDVTADVNAIADHLRLCIQARRITLRSVERELDMGVGYLGQLLRGNLDLKLKHLMAVLRVIGMEPEEFFSSLYSGSLPVMPPRPPAVSPPRHGGSGFPGRRTEEVVPGLSEAQLDQLIAQLMDRMGRRDLPRDMERDMEEEATPRSGARGSRKRR